MIDWTHNSQSVMSHLNLKNKYTKITIVRLKNCAISALTLLVGQQEGHPACKRLSGGILAWLSVWGKVQICT